MRAPTHDRLPLRAVLDTNIYVSAVLSPAGPSGRVLQALHRRVFAAISSRTILDEVVNVLTRDPVAFLLEVLRDR